jgi:uncharacterized protein (TIGR02301 family)
MNGLRLLATSTLIALTLMPALAQQRPAARQAPPPATQPAPPPPEAAPAPYEADLIKLAEILGSLALLRQVCEGTDKDVWAARMRALIEVEGRSPAIRDRLAGAFNQGFRAYALLHRRCTPASQEASVRLAREGDVLSRTLASRYGG